jgi:hypothetical protein
MVGIKRKLWETYLQLLKLMSQTFQRPLHRRQAQKQKLLLFTQHS